MDHKRFNQAGNRSSCSRETFRLSTASDRIPASLCLLGCITGFLPCSRETDFRIGTKPHVTPATLEHEAEQPSATATGADLQQQAFIVREPLYPPHDLLTHLCEVLRGLA